MLMEQLPDNRMAEKICILSLVMLTSWCASVCRSDWSKDHQSAQ